MIMSDVARSVLCRKCISMFTSFEVYLVTGSAQIDGFFSSDMTGSNDGHGIDDDGILLQEIEEEISGFYFEDNKIEQRFFIFYLIFSYFIF